MKIFLLLALLNSSLLISGCATDPEDKKFFETGWAHPKERDAVFGGD
jgi:hypothetical protein